MSRPFFSRERISHFELFDRHAGTFNRFVRVRISKLTVHLTDTTLNLMRERTRSNTPFDFQVLHRHPFQMVVLLMRSNRT